MSAGFGPPASGSGPSLSASGPPPSGPGPLVLDPHRLRLAEVASARGIAVADRSARWGIDAVELSLGGRSELVLEGRIFASLDAVADRICDHKHAAKAVLAELGIPAPRGVLFRDPERERPLIDAFWVEGARHVCKPVDGTEGRGVRLGLTERAELSSHWEAWRGEYEAFVVEEEVAGEDLRLQAIGGRIAAACTRRPAYVTGDGASPVRELVEARRKVMREQNPQNRLEVDADTLSWLARAGRTLESVPTAGEEVRLKTISNMSVGGVAVDVTDRIHPDYGSWVDAVAARLGLDIFALDIVATDPTAEPARAARVLEINARPQWLHHTFSERRTHDIPGLILDHLFAEP